MSRLLTEYEDATGMLANKKKFEGIRCGALKRKLVPTTPELRADRINWVKPGEYVRILGIPFWESYNIELFYEKLYSKAKGLLAAWKNVPSLGLVGRSMLVNSMLYGRFRYYITVEPMPRSIETAIQEDAQVLLWSKEAVFEANEMGSELTNRRWMKKEAQFLPRKRQLGAGVLHWEAHTEGIQIHKLLKYRDASRGPWKNILDTWLDREHIGRGAIFAHHRLKDLIQSTHDSASGESKLPKFWIQALKALQKLPLSPADPNHFSQDGVKSIPYSTVMAESLTPECL